MAIRIVQRIAFNPGIVPRMVDQHIFPFRRLRKTVVAGAILMILIAGAKYGLRRFMPVLRAQRVGQQVYPQESHAVVFIGRAGGIADKQLLPVNQNRRTFIDPKTTTFPVKLRFAQHYRLTF